MLFEGLKEHDGFVNNSLSQQEKGEAPQLLLAPPRPIELETNDMTIAGYVATCNLELEDKMVTVVCMLP